MTIGKNDGLSDLDAYQFGLGEATTQGSITLTPRIQQASGQLFWRKLQHADERGLYATLKLPVGAMIVEHCVSETPAQISQVEDDWSKYTVLANRFDTIEEALIGGFENKEPDFKYGRLSKEKLSVVRVGDLEFALGYNPYVGDRGYVGVGFKFSAPTGNVPTARYMLEPIVGRAGHWSVGGEVHGRFSVYECDDYELDLQMRGEVLHLTSGRKPHWRSFDLAANGDGSKYMLLQRYKTEKVVGGSGTVVVPDIITPAINVTTVPVLSRISAEGNFALMLDFKKDCWNMSLSGEIWGRSSECLEIDTCRLARYSDKLNLNDYAVLGRQVSRDDRFTDNVANAAANLNFAEPAAKINESVDRITASGTAPAGPAVAPTLSTAQADKVKDATVSANRIPADFETALNVAGAQAPRVITGKVTVEAGYTFKDSCHMPHVSLYGGVEIADKTSRAPNFWSLGLQGSMQF